MYNYQIDYCIGQIYEVGGFKVMVVFSTRYLHVSGQTYGRPIAGQYEVSATAAKSRGNLWQAMVCVSMSLDVVMMMS